MFRQRAGLRFYTTHDMHMYPLLADAIVFASPAAAWVWGDWVQIIPAGHVATDFLICGLHILPRDFATPRSYVMQIGQGGPGSEVPIIDLAGSWQRSSDAGFAFIPFTIAFSIPRKVMAGTRLSMRAADEKVLTYHYEGKIQYIELPPV